MYPPLFAPFILVTITERRADAHQAVGRKWSMKCVVPQEEDLRLQTLIHCTCSLLYQLGFMGNTYTAGTLNRDF